MPKEVITINVGQCGIQSSNTIWKQYCAEHKIDKNGRLLQQPKNNNFKSFFQETGNGQYFARNISVDLEETVIDDIRTGEYSKMFNPEYLLSGSEDAANNFARGHYTLGKEMIDKINNKIRKLVNQCGNVQGFIINHSVGGGTGSGLGSLIFERIAVDYAKKSKLGFEVYPSPTISTSVVEPYNALLSTHWLLDHTEVSLVLDNEALYGICQKQLKIKKPNYDNLNKIIGKVVSSMTASLRFDGELNVDLGEFQTNLVPFPRLHFMTTSLAPIISKTEKGKKNAGTVRKISEYAFDPSNFLVKYTDFNPAQDKYMAINLNYRGDIRSNEANSTVSWLKNNNKVSMVEWCPTGFKFGLNDIVAAEISNDDLLACNKSAVMIGNNVAISRVFNRRINAKFDLLYGQRAFVHWYVGEGMEEGEFAEAREDLRFLENDYLDVLSG